MGRSLDYRGSVRSLAEDIRSRSDDELARLLRMRPDLARPQPADLTALAIRASTHASTSRAIDHLDLDHLVALQAAHLAEPVDPDSVAALTGTSAETTGRLLDDLHAAALLWDSPTGRTPTRTGAEVLAPDLATLGPPFADLGLTPPGDLDAALTDLPAEAVTVLERLAWRGPSAARPGEGSRAGEAVARLVTDHLLAADGEEVTLPREVGLRVRAGLTSPPPTTAAKGADHADRVAAGAVGELVADLDELLRRVDALRPRVLRNGGLAVRDLRELARRSGLTEERTLLLLEMAREADLLADDHAVEPTWRLTHLADAWHTEPDPQRWHALVRPWLASLRAPTTPRDEDSRGNALADELTWPPVRALRLEVLGLLAHLPPGAADAETVTAALRRARPRRLPRRAAEVVAGLLDELTALGLVALGTVSLPGRLLADDPADVAGSALAAVTDLVPEPVEQVLLQADLTAVVPGVPAPELADLLRRSATLESRGGAAVFRFTEASIRGALDTGWVADDLLESIGRHSATPVPQPLEYLVRDVARRHGTLRVGSTASYLRSDDATHLETLLRHRDLGHLQLRQIAPTVLVSPTSPAVLVESLREVGANPALETAGGVVSSAPSARRATPPRRRAVTEVAPEDPATVVARLREAEARPRPEAARGPSIPALDPVSSAAILREAAADRLPVWVGVTDAVGSTTKVLFHPLRVEGGRAVGEVDGSPRTLSLHRITGVTEPHPGHPHPGSR